MYVSPHQKTDKPLTVGVTGLNANDNPGPGLAVIRALRDGFGEGIRIIGLAYETLEPAVYLRNQVNKTYRIPYPAAGAEALKERIAQVQEIEKLDVIIPNFDAELYNFIKIEGFLKSIGIQTFLPTAIQLEQRDKVNLYPFAQKNGFNVPESQMVFDESDLQELIAQYGFPMVIKGKFYEADIVNHTADAHKAFHKLNAKWGLPIIAQKFVNGTEINIAGLGDGQGNTLSVIPMRKLYITEKGKAWAGITIENDKLVNLAKDFAKATHWKGGFELEVIMDEKGELYIIEVNPRFPAWIYLSAAAGQNQPMALVNLALGKQVDEFKSYQTGKMFIRYAWDNIVDVEDFQKLSAFGEL